MIVIAIIFLIPVIWMGLYLWGGRGYAERQKLRELTLRGRADAERSLESKGAMPRDPERPDWTLRDQSSHPLLKSHSIAEDGTIRLVLRGHEDLDGKELILTPSIADGKVNWSCTTDIAMRFRPNECRNQQERR